MGRKAEDRSRTEAIDNPYKQSPIHRLPDSIQISITPFHMCSNPPQKYVLLLKPFTSILTHTGSSGPVSHHMNRATSMPIAPITQLSVILLAVPTKGVTDGDEVEVDSVVVLVVTEESSDAVMGVTRYVVAVVVELVVEEDVVELEVEVVVGISETVE